MTVKQYIGVILTGTNEKLRVLLLAYYFPPDSSSGALRPLYFANHLVQCGVDVTVITPREEDFLPEQPVDPQLLLKLHPRVRIIRSKVWRPREFVLGLRRKKDQVQNQDDSPPSSGNLPEIRASGKKLGLVQSVKDLVTDLLASPDPHVGWITDCVRCAREIIKEDGADIILATGSPWSSMIAGVLLRRRTGIPLLLDFRDPWTTNPGFIQRGKIAAFLERRMERLVVARTDGIIANTEELRENIVHRFSFLHEDIVHTLPNGFEEYVKRSQVKNEKFTLVHAGALYFSRTPVPLLQALFDLLAEEKIPVTGIRIVLVGETDENPDLQQLLQQPSVQATVEIIPRVPYEKAMQYQLQADALLLVQPGFPLQVPRKLYEYMAMKKTILALTDSSGATARIVKECSLGEVVENKREAIKPVLLKMYNSWFEGTNEQNFNESTDKYRNSKLTERLNDIMKQTIAKRN